MLYVLGVRCARVQCRFKHDLELFDRRIDEVDGRLDSDQTDLKSHGCVRTSGLFDETNTIVKEGLVHLIERVKRSSVDDQRFNGHFHDVQRRGDTENMLASSEVSCSQPRMAIYQRDG